MLWTPRSLLIHFGCSRNLQRLSEAPSSRSQDQRRMFVQTPRNLFPRYRLNQKPWKPLWAASRWSTSWHLQLKIWIQSSQWPHCRLYLRGRRCGLLPHPSYRSALRKTALSLIGTPLLILFHLGSYLCLKIPYSGFTRSHLVWRSLQNRLSRQSVSLLQH